MPLTYGSGDPGEASSPSDNFAGWCLRDANRAIREAVTSLDSAKRVAAYLRQQAAIMHRADSRPFLHEIKCPTLVLCGRRDVVTPVEVHQELVDSIAGSSFTVIDQCGHLSPLGQPQQVTDALKGWLLRIAH